METVTQSISVFGQRQNMLSCFHNDVMMTSLPVDVPSRGKTQSVDRDITLL